MENVCIGEYPRAYVILAQVVGSATPALWNDVFGSMEYNFGSVGSNTTKGGN